MKDRKPKVLLVDDEESFTRVAKLLLVDYDICVENDSARALEAARNFKPDLILLDVMMPNFDGGDVAAQIRDDPGLRHVPIVFLTGLAVSSLSPNLLRQSGWRKISTNTFKRRKAASLLILAARQNSSATLSVGRLLLNNKDSVAHDHEHEQE
jgi:CheY-like chemotaxis protein